MHADSTELFLKFLQNLLKTTSKSPNIWALPICSSDQNVHYAALYNIPNCSPIILWILENLMKCFVKF